MNPSDADTASIFGREAYLELCSLGEQFGSFPSNLIAHHLISIYPDVSFVVHLAALEAVRRCFNRSRKRSWRIEPLSPRSERPRAFEISLNDEAHLVLLHGEAPIEARCSCSEFLRNSLGLCEHVVAALQHGARGSQPTPSFYPRANRPQRVIGGWSWDPISHLTRVDDPLSRLRWHDDAHAAELPMEISRHLSVRAPRQVLTGTLQTPSRRLAFLRAAVSALESESKDRHHRAGPKSGSRSRVGTTPRDPMVVRIPDTPSTTTFKAHHRHSARHLLDPSAAAVLRDELAHAERRAALRKARRRAIAALEELHTKLYDHQRDAVSRFLLEGRLFLADDMGLGKTAQGIACAHALYQAGLVERGMIIVPAPLKSQWYREWRAFSDTPVTLLAGNPEQRRATYNATTQGFLIANYEQLFRGLDDLLAWDPEFVVLDEAHRIKNPDTLTARSVAQLSPTYRLLLSGTPFQNRLAEFGAVTSWVDDRALEPQWRLTAAHTWYTEGAESPNGLTHLNALRARVAPFLLRRLRSDVLTSLPQRTDAVIVVPTTPQQQEAHQSRVRKIRELFEYATRERPLTTKEYLQLMALLNTQRVIANSLIQLEWEERWPEVRETRPTPDSFYGLDSPKLEALYELVNELLAQPNRKIVVFSQWLRFLELAHWALREVLERHEARALFFSGKERAKRRQTHLVEFHDDPTARLLLATDAGGTGLNLQRAADCCILLEVPWNPAVTEQRVARIHRIGQVRPIEVYQFVSEDSIECHLSQRVEMKRATFNEVLDGHEDRLELNGITLFEQIFPLVDAELDSEEESDAPNGTSTPSSRRGRPKRSRSRAEESPAATAETPRHATPSGRETSTSKASRVQAERDAGNAASPPPPSPSPPPRLDPAAFDTTGLSPELATRVSSLLEELVGILSHRSGSPDGHQGNG